MSKRTEVICTKLDERMALALLREASKEDRTISEFLYLLIRRELYGRNPPVEQDEGQSTSGDKVDR